MSKLFLIAVLCILGASLTKAGLNMQEAVDLHMKITEDCMAEVGATPADIEDMANVKPSAGMPGKCLRACLMKKVNVMDNDGKMDKDVILEHSKIFTGDDLNKIKIVHEVLDACLSIDVPSDHCEAAEAYGNCYKAEAIARGISNLDF